MYHTIFIHSCAQGHIIRFQFTVIINRAAINIGSKCFWGRIKYPLDIWPRVVELDLEVVRFLSLEETITLFSILTEWVRTSTRMHENSFYSTSLSAWAVSCFVDISYQICPLREPWRWKGRKNVRVRRDGGHQETTRSKYTREKLIWTHRDCSSMHRVYTVCTRSLCIMASNVLFIWDS